MKGLKFVLTILVLPLALMLAAGVARADTVYVIQPGDSLFRIALRYGVTVDALVEANNIVNPSLIVAGQELIITGVDNPVGTGPVPTATPVNALIMDAPPANATAVDGGVIHVVGPKDTLFSISMLYNVSINDIMAANNMTNPRVVRLGKELFIPGATLGTTGSSSGTTTTTSPVVAATPAPSSGGQAVSGNLFKNGSFEEGWHYYLYNELQIPDGWQVAIDEGPNTLSPGAGGNFARPEIRNVSSANLAESEQDLCIFDGDKTLKAFKGYAPTIFHFFQDVYLQPGRYRMTLNFFPDLVASYDGGRVFVTDPLSGEVRIIHNDNVYDWTTVTPGQKNNRVYEFTVNQAGGVRLGASFRNRFAPANNGWFLDDWRLEKIQ